MEFFGSINDPRDIRPGKDSTPSIRQLLPGHLLVSDHDHGDLAPGLAGVQHLGGGGDHLWMIQVHNWLYSQGYGQVSGAWEQDYFIILS